MINKNLLKEEASNLGVKLDEVSLDKFDKYAELLVYWNERINLTAIIDPEGIVYKHFLDSLAFLKYVDLPENAKIIDVGTGAGFPGLALKISRPDLDVTLLDSTQKKLNVVGEISKKIDSPVTLVHARAEEAGHDSSLRECFDFSTARAVSNLHDLSEYCLPFVKLKGSFISMKGSDAKAELDAAKSAIEILGGKIKSFETYELEGCGERAILNIEKVSKTLDKYPRPKAQMLKKPL